MRKYNAVSFKLKKSHSVPLSGLYCASIHEWLSSSRHSALLVGPAGCWVHLSEWMALVCLACLHWHLPAEKPSSWRC